MTKIFISHSRNILSTISDIWYNCTTTSIVWSLQYTNQKANRILVHALEAKNPSYDINMRNFEYGVSNNVLAELYGFSRYSLASGTWLKEYWWRYFYIIQKMSHHWKLRNKKKMWNRKEWAPNAYSPTSPFFVIYMFVWKKQNEADAFSSSLF